MTLRIRMAVVMIALGVAASALLCSCHNNRSTATQQTTFTDDYNRTVDVPNNPKRIVSVSPAVTEIIYALGAADRLVGRTDFCTYPADAAKIESIGGISNLNVEKILSLNPDIVISGSMVPEKSVEQLEKMGVPVVCIIEKPSFDGIYQNILRIGQLTNKAQQADSINERIRTQVEALRDSTPIDQRPSLYYVVGYGKGGNFTAGGESFINDIIALAGARNIASDLKGWEYSLEALVDNDPEYILIRQEDSAGFCQQQPYSKLSAVKNNRVIAIESGMIDLQVPRNIDAIHLIRNRIK